MFRHPLRPFVRLLMALVAAGAEPAFAAANVTEVIFTVTITESSEAPDDIRAEIRVKGTDLNNARITFPGSTAEVPLAADGADLARTDTYANEAELDAFFPAGNYGLLVNNGTLTATIAYQRAPVPSPDISQPDDGQVVAPGAVEVLFSACPICTQAGDSVEALLTQGTTALAGDTLTASDESWIPSDSLGGDLQLTEESTFTATITSTALLQSNPSASGDENGVFLFTSRFVRSDAVTFDTGFDAPSGDFCIVVNDPTPPVGCTPVSESLLSILDTSGSYSTSVDGHTVVYDISVGAQGDITGSASADLDDDTIRETVGAVRGKLGGKAGLARQKLSFPLENPGLEAKLKVGVSGELSIPADALASVQKASGSLGELRIEEESSDAQTPLPVAAQGWRLDFVLGAEGGLETALLTLDGGRSFELEGSNKFKFASGVSSLKLQSAGKGISVQLKKLGLDDSTEAVTAGDLSYRILGQSGRVSLP